MPERRFAAKVRDKLSAKLLPTSEPVRSFVGYWDGGACAGCDTPIRSHQTTCQIEMEDGSRFELHLGCHALWLAERHRGRWVGPSPPDQARAGARPG
jgi:hypothetical protein